MDVVKMSSRKIQRLYNWNDWMTQTVVLKLIILDDMSRYVNAVYSVKCVLP
mgnify:CR=1 FL=1